MMCKLKSASLLYEDDKLLVGYYSGCNENSNIVITFSSFSLPSSGVNLECWSKLRHGFQERYLIEINQRSIFFISKNNDWYHNASMESAFSFLFDKGYLKKDSKVLLHGASMGGYGALKALSYIQATSIFLGSPQLCVNRNSGLVPNESRWPGIIDKLDHEQGICFTALSDSEASIYVAYDPMHVLDYNQLRLFPSQCNLKLIPVNNAGHSAFIKLKALGQLDDLMFAFVQNLDIHEAYEDQIKDRVEIVSIDKLSHVVNNNSHPADMLRDLSLCFASKSLKKDFLNAALSYRPHGKLIQKMIEDIEG